METLIANLRIGKARRATLNGREYLVAPMTLIVPGVLNGSRGPLYYPPDEVARDVAAWNGMPLTLGHPHMGGLNVSARSPGVVDQFGLGTVYGTAYNSEGKLVAEAWFDKELTQRKGPQVFQALNAGTPIELSTGLFTENTPAQQGFKDHLGQPYSGMVARNYKPDHLAILVGQKGACSLNDGCGVLINSASKVPTGNCKATGKPGPCKGWKTAGKVPTATPATDSPVGTAQPATPALAPAPAPAKAKAKVPIGSFKKGVTIHDPDSHEGMQKAVEQHHSIVMSLIKAHPKGTVPQGPTKDMQPGSPEHTAATLLKQEYDKAHPKVQPKIKGSKVPTGFKKQGGSGTWSQAGSLKSHTTKPKVPTT